MMMIKTDVLSDVIGIAALRKLAAKRQELLTALTRCVLLHKALRPKTYDQEIYV
jgi:hypothetical protein